MVPIDGSRECVWVMNGVGHTLLVRDAELFCLTGSACLSQGSTCTISSVGHRAIIALLPQSQLPIAW